MLHSVPWIFGIIQSSYSFSLFSITLQAHFMSVIRRPCLGYSCVVMDHISWVWAMNQNCWKMWDTCAMIYCSQLSFWLFTVHCKNILWKSLQQMCFMSSNLSILNRISFFLCLSSIRFVFLQLLCCFPSCFATKQFMSLSTSTLTNWLSHIAQGSNGRLTHPWTQPRHARWLKVYIVSPLELPRVTSAQIPEEDFCYLAYSFCVV